MSLRVGLGDSQADIDVQGEIDFDFFDESDYTGNSKKTSISHKTATLESPRSDSYDCHEKPLRNDDVNPAEYDPNSLNAPEKNSCNFSKPLITISCDDITGHIQKTTIETVIPTPFNYKDNKCEKNRPSNPRKGVLSPYLKSKIFKDENDVSDDSSISSMSDSESNLSGSSDNSKETSDSMTDVSPFLSPSRCCTPNNNDGIKDETVSTSETKKDGVKFPNDIDGKECPKCQTIDFHELIRAVKHLDMEQNINGICQEKRSSPPILTHNARCRKNLSFSNKEVRQIDYDNQVLLKKIVAQQNRPVVHSNSSSLRVMPSSAVNRHRHQRQIELENLALLKRLESTKPSRDLSRFHLLRDYERRSSGVLSRASSRSSHTCSSSSRVTSCQSSTQPSGRSSATSLKSNSSFLHSCSVSAVNKH